eukprot:5076612-Pyramimonas_sp.AAC.1
MPIIVSSGPAHSRPPATTRAVPVKKPLDSDRGMAAHDPDLAARCMLYCRGGSPAHTREYADTPAVLVKSDTKCSRASRTRPTTLSQSVFYR